MRMGAMICRQAMAPGSVEFARKHAGRGEETGQKIQFHACEKVLDVPPISGDRDIRIRSEKPAKPFCDTR